MKAQREWMCHDLERKPVLISGVWVGRWGGGVYLHASIVYQFQSICIVTLLVSDREKCAWVDGGSVPYRDLALPVY
jgi:hypothetical protein